METGGRPKPLVYEQIRPIADIVHFKYAPTNSMWPKVCHNGSGANARFVFCQLNSNIVNNSISTKALT